MKNYSSKMYKMLFFSVVLAASFLASSAQEQKNYSEIINKSAIKKEILNLGERNLLLKQQGFIRSSKLSSSLIKSRLGRKYDSKSTICTKSYITKSGTNLYTVPDLLVGSFQSKGISYWGGYIIGEVIITTDSIDQNKIWIENLIPGSSNQKVYGIVANDQTTLTIPQGQFIFKDNEVDVKLTVYNSLSAIVGKFNAATGVLTISTDLWGAKASDGWVELYSGNVTYTRLDMLPPVALYQQPLGAIFLGMDPDTWDGYSSSCIISSPYVTWNWKNNALDNEVDYSWSYEELLNNYSYTSDEDSLFMDVEDSFYNVPTLKATNNKGHTSSYVLGADYKNKNNESFIVAGGNAVWVGFDENCDYSSANIDNGFTLLANGEDAYYFGTGASSFADADYESLLVYYDSLQTALYFEGVNVYLFVLDAPENTPFTMNVFGAEKDEEGFSVKGDLIASSTILAKDAVQINYDNEVVGYTLKFANFEIKDEDGFSIAKEYFEMEDDFYLELTGFNVEGVSLAVATEEISPSNGESRSLFTVKNDESIYYWEDYRQSMYFNLSGAAFPYVTFSQKMIYDNKLGGTYYFDAIPYFDTLYVAEQILPEWLDVEIESEEYSSNNWGAKVKVTIDALPENESPRNYDLFFKSIGATKSILINQGGTVSSPILESSQSVFAQKSQDGFLISYPDNFKEMNIYSITGSLIGNYRLPSGGQFQLLDSELANGLYLLKLSGNSKTEVVKISK